MSLLGIDGVNSRIATLQARLDSLSPKPDPVRTSTTTGTNPASFHSTLTGAISGGGIVGSGEPIDPLAPGLNGLDGMIKDAAERNGVDPSLFAALVQQESGGDPNAVSRCYAKGLCQLMPTTAASLGVNDPFDPAQNLDGGARYLKQQLDKFGGKEDLALAAYNWGPGHVEKNPGSPLWPSETRNYVKSILSRVNR